MNYPVICRAVLLVIMLSACGASKAPAQVTPTTPADSNAVDALPPAGYGQFNQDAITLRLRSGPLEIRVVPLDERVLRLLSPDGYRSLRQLIDANQTRIDSIADRANVREPGIALVSFFAITPGTRFDPNLLFVTQRNQLLRPIGVIPLSPAMSAQQLDVGTQATGLFLLEDLIPVTEQFSISYLGATANDWERRLSRLDAERSRIRGRVGKNEGTP